MKLQRMIDASFEKPEDKRHYLGASAVGNECPRKTQYYWLTILGRLEPIKFEGRIKRIFDRGYVYESKMVEWMHEVGFVFEQDPTKLELADFSTTDVPQGRFKGHVDGVLLDGPDDWDYPILWENKCLNNKSYMDVKERGVKLSKYGYYCQVQIYMAYLKLDKCLFTIINADTMAIHEEVIPIDPVKINELKAIVADVFETTERNKLVRKTNNRYHCKFCDYKEVCT